MAGRSLKSSIVLKKQDFFRKLASIFLDQLLPHSVEKCNVELGRGGCTLFQVIYLYKQNSIFVLEDRSQHLAWWILCLEHLWTCGTTASPFSVLFFGFSIVLMDPSFIHSYEMVKNPSGSRWNLSKVASEASTGSHFWLSLRHLRTL
jgi:hypothetical protein